MPVPEIPLLPAAFPKNDETELINEPTKSESVHEIPLTSGKHRTGFAGRLVSFCTCAVIAASCIVSFDDILESSFLPDGYIMKDNTSACHAALEVSAKLLPMSKPYDETPAGTDIAGSDIADTENTKEQSAVQDDIPEGELRIVEYDFSGTGLSNETSYKPDLAKLLEMPLPFDSYPKVLNLTAESPEVLIIHTHGSEAYTDSGKVSYPADSGMRSYDISENVVAVGSVIAERLNLLGVDTLHLTTMFDEESYYNSYNRSLEAVRSCLKQYPSIRYVIDVHRDAAADLKRGIAYKPVTVVDGQKCAQLMLVVGTDHSGASHPGWQDNLSIALKLNELLREVSDTLMRPINLRGASFNQQYSPGFLLLEAGSCGNTLDEAKRSGIHFADALAKLIKNE